jgi:hypothetical protein
MKLVYVSKVALKILIGVAIALFVLILCAAAFAKGGPQRVRPSVAPHVVSQKQHGDVRYLYVHNTLDRAIWAYFECEDHLTTTPIGIGRAHVAEVRIPGIGPDEQCSLNHYRIQVQGQSPPAWTPYNDFGSDRQ